MQTDQPIQTPSLAQSQMSTEQGVSPSQSTPMPPVPTEIPKKTFPALIVLIVVILGLLGGLGYLGYQNYVSNKQITDLNNTLVATPTPNPDPTANWTERKFEKFKLTFKAPSELTMEELELNPNQFTAYIQNDKVGEDFFQMEFMYQKIGKQVKESDIQTLQNDPKFIVPGTARNVAIDGYAGFAGEVAGKSSRFITAIIKDGYWLIIYTKEPTQTNKELSDRIMSTFKFTK